MKKSKVSFTIKIFENVDLFADRKACVRQTANNVFEVYVPHRGSIGFLTSSGTAQWVVDQSAEKHIFSTWCHELGHVVASIFGLVYNSLDGRCKYPPLSPNLKMLECIFGPKPFGKRRTKESEQEAWGVAEVIAAFDRNKQDALECYHQSNVKQIEEEFNSLFSS